MEQVSAIIDLDGFQTVEFGFLAREFGFIKMDGGRPQSYRYDLSPFWHGLSTKSKKSVYFCENFVHGLRFNPWSLESVRPHWELERDVIRLYKTCGDTIGYKGGCVERRLLEELGIPSVNVEDFGCPRYDVLNADGRYNKFMCGHHEGNLHCSESEVLAFRDFLLSQ